MRVLHVAGARPNFMKVGPVLRELGERGITNVLVHTGQHYDREMSGAFFEDLGLPEPDVHLDVGSGSHAAQTARVMERLEPVILAQAPDLVIVVGDVNSTCGAALVCAKLLVPVAHIEAGLRSFDRTMPEEVNRIVTDQLSDLLFTTSPEAQENLAREGIAPDRIHFVGNTMIDSLERHLRRARESDVLERLGVRQGDYGVVTLHRPATVDRPEALAGVIGALRDIAQSLPLVFPAHPRTVEAMARGGLDLPVLPDGPVGRGAIAVIDPVGYVDFLRLLRDARCVFTDSGGVQEETTILDVPCLTLRPNTERPITVSMGTNHLVGTDPEAIVLAAKKTLAEPPRPAARPPLWDGRASERIADVIVGWFSAARG